jgi:REP element-mobilizing transposase RayT
MGFAYRINYQQGLYFVTFTVQQWINIFSRKEYVEIIIESIKFCQVNKGLLVHGWVIMTNHMHAIISCRGENKLSDIIRDFKKYTSRQIIEKIEENPPAESRKNWLMWLFNSKDEEGNKSIKFWKEGSHPEEIHSEKFFFQKLNYIHNNPVKAGYVDLPAHWCWSSAAHFNGKKGLIDLSYSNV